MLNLASVAETLYSFWKLGTLIIVDMHLDLLREIFCFYSGVNGPTRKSTLKKKKKMEVKK